MQATNPITVSRVNWSLGLRALLIASALAGMSGASGSPIAMYAAVLVAGWAVVKPLPLGSWLFSRDTLHSGGQVAATIGAIVVAAFILSLAADSQVPVIFALGNLLFIGLIAAVAVIVARYMWKRASTLTPSAWTGIAEAAVHARVQVQAVWGAILSR